MTTPSIVSSRYIADSSAYRNAKVDRSGAAREEAFTVTVPASTVSGTIIGLVPFQTGAKFGYDSTIFNSALGASVTGTVGYVYDDNVTFTNDPDAFALSQATATAGKVNLNNPDGVPWKAIDSVPTGATGGALANGWIVFVTGGATTAGTAQTISGHIVLAYDQP